MSVALLLAEGAVATVVLCLFGPGTVKRGIATDETRYFRGIVLIWPRHGKTGHAWEDIVMYMGLCVGCVGHASSSALVSCLGVCSALLYIFLFLCDGSIVTPRRTIGRPEVTSTT